jgi:hypothetical protein
LDVYHIANDFLIRSFSVIDLGNIHKELRKIIKLRNKLLYVCRALLTGLPCCRNGIKHPVSIVELTTLKILS